MSSTEHHVLNQVDELLNLPSQIWLLGAGISRDAGIPLMKPLTEQVEARLDESSKTDFTAIRSALPATATVEEVMSHIGDLISIARRAENREASMPSGEARSYDQLIALHRVIQKQIREIIRSGYRPADGASAAEEGFPSGPIVQIDHHLDFVDALFGVRRAGLERRPLVTLATTNYDTLLEDALALGRVAYADGFAGGAMGFWDGRLLGTQTVSDAGNRARILKLHGSIDWYTDEARVALRRRDGASYPPSESIELLIYPQAAKYYSVRYEPFVSLFQEFRAALLGSPESGLFVCGYSFRDDHINEEIEKAMARAANNLTLVAFVEQDDDRDVEPTSSEGLPDPLARWLRESWGERVIVAGSRGFYHGSLENQLPVNPGVFHAWWSFQGVTDFLRSGPEAVDGAV